MDYFKDDKEKLDKKLGKILDSLDSIDSIFTYYENSLELNQIDAQYLKIKELIDEYIIALIKKESKKDIEIKRISNYLSVLYDHIINNPSIAFSNPVLKLNQDILKTYYKDMYNEIENAYINASKKAKIIYEEFINNENKVKEEDYLFLIDYFINNISTNSQELISAQTNTIKKILNSNKNYKDLKTKYFILKYLSKEKSKELGLKINLYFCDSNLDDLNNSTGQAFENNIFINASFFRNSNLNDLRFVDLDKYSKVTIEKAKKEGLPIYKMFYSLFHEMNHVMQYKKMSEGVLDIETLSMIEAIIFEKYYSKDEYKKNYNFYEIEKECNIFAGNELTRFYYLFYPKNLKQIDNEMFEMKFFESKKRSYSYKKDKEDICYSEEFFVADNLNKIIKENKNLLTEYPSLRYIYNEDGTLLSLEELLLNKKSENNKVFDKFIIYYIKKRYLDKLDLSKYDFELDLLLIIEDIMFSEIKDLYDIKNYYDKDEDLKNNSYDIIMQKIDVIIKIYNFLNKKCIDKKYNIVNYAVSEDFKKFNKVLRDLEIKLNKKIEFNIDMDYIESIKYR